MAMTNEQLYAPTYQGIRDLLSRLFATGGDNIIQSSVNLANRAGQAVRNAPGQFVRDVNQGVEFAGNPAYTSTAPFVEPAADAPPAPAPADLYSAPARRASPIDNGMLASRMQGGVRSGPNSRIDDATRAQALAWALRNAQAGGA